MTGAPYLAKPCKMDPVRDSGFRMGQKRKDNDSWIDRMAEDKTRVEVHLSTDPTEEAWQSWELSGEPDDVFRRVKRHMEFRRQHGTLQPGRYCITVPGHDHKHSFEVE